VAVNHRLGKTVINGPFSYKHYKYLLLLTDIFYLIITHKNSILKFRLKDNPYNFFYSKNRRFIFEHRTRVQNIKETADVFL